MKMKTNKKRNLMDNGEEQKQLKRFMQFEPPSDDLRISFVLATENPVDRGTFYEILSCKETDCDYSRLNEKAIPLLFNHHPDKIIGKVDKIWFEDGKCKGEAYLSKNAIAEIEDIKSGILNSISASYLTQPKPIETKEINGKRAIKFGWIMLEVSVVTVAADPYAGIGKRSLEQKIETNSANIDTQSENKGNTKMEINEISEALELATKHNQMDLAKDYIKTGKSMLEFRSALLGKIENKTALPVVEQKIKENDNMTNRYSILRAIASLDKTDHDVDATYEREVSKQLKRSGYDGKGLLAPLNIFSRDFSIATTSGNLVDSKIVEVLEPLYKETVAAQLGVSLMSGCKGTQLISKLTKGSAAWIATEGGSLPDSSPAAEQIVSNPRSIGGKRDVSRLQLKQATVSADAIVTRDLTNAITEVFEDSLFNADGTSGAPVGLYKALQTAVVGNADYGKIEIAVPGTPTFKEILSFETAIRKNLVKGDVKFIMSHEVYALLASTPRASGANGFIIDNGLCVGRQYIVSDYVDGIILGKWDDAMILSYGNALDLQVDPYVLGNFGVRVNAVMDVDVVFRRLESFVYATNAEMLGA